MADNLEQINLLLQKIDQLSKKQDEFLVEINELKSELIRLRKVETNEPIMEHKVPVEPIEIVEVKVIPVSTPKPIIKEKKSFAFKTDLEKFIGENLINKIGIAITVIGVSIGAKYSIENNLISPLTRIILGYLSGIALLVVAIKLKSNYKNYSAVLLSGAIAILYFITYAGYSYYDLYPQLFAFVLMFVFTGFTVVAAIKYDNQIIAHIGLVGAYAVPFLLSDGSGKVGILFTYMFIINIGILILSFKKYWKPLYYSAFIITWLIFGSWYVAKYQSDLHFELALIFSFIFFTTFYITFLAYKLQKNEQFQKLDILLLLSNSFIFYGFGYGILGSHETGKQLLGLFTLVNAIIHFSFSAVIYYRNLADRNLFYLVAGMVLVFITIAIPVQLDGKWVSILWSGEAALLFWIGRTKNITFYEQLSYPLVILAFFSVVSDWSFVYNYYHVDDPETKLLPLLNINFLTSILFIGSLLFINILHRNKSYISGLASKKDLIGLINYTLPTILIFSIYYALHLEISNYWNQLYQDSRLEIPLEDQEYLSTHFNTNLFQFKLLWLINYTFLFLSVLSYLNIKKVKNPILAYINLGFNTFTIVLFLFLGSFLLSSLRANYVNQYLAEYYHIGIFNILIRYICFSFVALILVASYKYIRQEFLSTKLTVAYDSVLYIAILWIASGELIHWMDMAKSTQSHKLGLSILWGIFALAIIVLGIWKKKKHLRIGAIILFGITLIKLFLYDISHLNTISKTIVFVSLGVLLLIISFLYNKYKHNIVDDIKN